MLQFLDISQTITTTLIYSTIKLKFKKPLSPQTIHNTFKLHNLPNIDPVPILWSYLVDIGLTTTNTTTTTYFIIITVFN